MRVNRWAIVVSYGKQVVMTVVYARKRNLSLQGIFDTKQEALECLKSIKMETT